MQRQSHTECPAYVGDRSAQLDSPPSPVHRNDVQSVIARESPYRCDVFETGPKATREFLMREMNSLLERLFFQRGKMLEQVSVRSSEVSCDLDPFLRRRNPNPWRPWSRTEASLQWYKVWALGHVDPPSLTP
jgi:hypothetical protein